MNAYEAIRDADTLEEAVGLTIGGASVCWESMEGTGVFQDQKALALFNALMERIHSDERYAR